MSRQDISPVLSIDAKEGTVSGPGGSVRLEPKVMEVLVVLARYSGHIVSRQELLDAVWPGAVVTEHTLSRCIYQLREGLRRAATDSETGEYNAIETLPKRGYRLMAIIEQSPGDFRVAGPSLLIELRRSTVLLVGLALFVLFVLWFVLIYPA